jgi:branched-chain amino acid transport system ATP-binding protein
MNPRETADAARMVRRIRDNGVTVLLVEHDMAAVMGVCDRIVVLDQGAKIAEGTPAEIRANQRVIEAYLGTDDDA